MSNAAPGSQGAADPYNRSLPICIVTRNHSVARGSTIPLALERTKLNFLCLRSLVRYTRLNPNPDSSTTPGLSIPPNSDTTPGLSTTSGLSTTLGVSTASESDSIPAFYIIPPHTKQPMPKNWPLTARAFAAASNYLEYNQQTTCTDPECNVNIRNSYTNQERPGHGWDCNLDVKLQSRSRVTALATTTPGPPYLHDAMRTEGIQETRWICAWCLGKEIEFEQKRVYMVAVNDNGDQCFGCQRYLQKESRMEHTALAFVF